MKPLTIDWKDFLKGESIADDMPNRGFSPDSYGLNLTKQLGVLYFAEGSTDRGSTTLVDNIVASTYDKNFLGNDGYFVGDEGNFYTISGATFTLRQTVVADTFQLGTTEIIQFQGATYCTGQTRVVQLTASNLTGVDSSWWTGLTTSYRHPMEVVEDKLYIGDVNNIHTYDGTTSTSAAIVLPTDVNITSLRKHPDGRNLIAFCGLTANFSHTNGNGGRIYIIDTNIKKWVREITIGVQVEGSRAVGGVIYCTYGQSLGYFDGNGVKFLKKLITSTTTYSHNLGDFENNLIVRDGLNVLAYGDLGEGMMWWNIYRNDINSKNINNILYKGDNKLLIAFQDAASAGYLREVDYDNAGTTGAFYSNKYIFPSLTQLKRFTILCEPTSGTTRYQVTQIAESNVPSGIIYDSNPNGDSQPSQYKMGCEIDIKTDIFQFNLHNSGVSSTGIGLKQIRFWYAPIEQ